MKSDIAAKERFIHEARAASALDHPNICTIHEIGETDDSQSYIVMACYEGQSLKEKIENDELTIDKSIDIVIQIANGLKRAHEAGFGNRVSAMYADAIDLPFRDNYAEIIVSRGSFHMWDDLKQGLSEIYRVLKPGGILSYKKTRGTEEKIIKEIEKAGFVFSQRQDGILLFAKTGSERNSQVH